MKEELVIVNTSKFFYISNVKKVVLKYFVNLVALFFKYFIKIFINY